MDSVKSTLKDALETLELSQLEYYPSRGAAGLAVAVQQAKNRLPDALKVYREALIASSEAVFVSGLQEQIGQFVSRALVLHNVFYVDMRRPYRVIAEQIEPSIAPNTRDFGVAQYDLLCTAIRDLATELGMTGTLPAPAVFNGIVANPEALIEKVRDLIRASIGNDLAFYWLVKRFGDVAIAAKCDTPATLVFYNALPDEVVFIKTKMASSREIEIKPDDVVNEDFVIYGMKPESDNLSDNSRQEPLSNETSEPARGPGRPKKNKENQ